MAVLEHDLTKAIDLALADGNHTRALKLAAKGQRLCPEDTELQKIAKILAPPKVIRTNIPPAEGPGLSIRWLKENRQHYQGKWVAVQNGVLLGHASSRAELSAMLDETDSSTMIVTKIPESLSK